MRQHGDRKHNPSQIVQKGYYMNTDAIKAFVGTLLCILAAARLEYLEFVTTGFYF